MKEVLEDAVKVILDCNEEALDNGSFDLCYKSKTYIPFRKATKY